MSSLDPSQSSTDDPLDFGVGARITISVMSSDYINIILGALSKVPKSDLLIETGDVSTYIQGPESSILTYLTDLSSLIASSPTHSSIIIHLFRGCPGSTSCAKPGPRNSPNPTGRKTNQFVTAEWALYPLSDGQDGGDHMKEIYEAIDFAKEGGAYKGSKGSVTRLEGDLGVVLECVVRGWVGVGRKVQHVTSHLTISVNSPSHAGRVIEG
jgi:hypothetical protein